MLAFSVCRSGGSSFTSTIVLPLPSSRPTLAVRFYSPGFNSENAYSPWAPVTEVAVSAVALLVRDNAAPGMAAPVGSVIVPLSPPVTIVCAQAPSGTHTIAAQLRIIVMINLVLFISSYPPQRLGFRSAGLNRHTYPTRAASALHRHSTWTWYRRPAGRQPTPLAFRRRRRTTQLPRSVLARDC